MDEFRFYQPIQVRYGDIDPQRHVNNSRFFTYMEQARASYFQKLGLWDGVDFDNLGMILLELTITFHEPILYGQSIRVGMRTDHMGNKSMKVSTVIEDSDSKRQIATGRSVLVAYDYSRTESIPIPADWRSAIAEFEGI